MQVFDNPESFQKALREELEKRGYEEELITELVEELTTECEVSPEDPRSDDYALAGPGAKWVIRNEHLNIIGDIFAGAGARKGTNTLLELLEIIIDVSPEAKILADVIGVGVGTIRAGVRCYKNIIYLTERQAQVVLMLKQSNNPLTIEELTKDLNLVFNRPDYDQTEWDEGKTEETLHSLEKVKTKSGDTESIVSCNEKEQWRVVGI